MRAPAPEAGVPRTDEQPRPTDIVGNNYITHPHTKQSPPAP